MLKFTSFPHFLHSTGRIALQAKMKWIAKGLKSKHVVMVNSNVRIVDAFPWHGYVMEVPNVRMMRNTVTRKMAPAVQIDSFVRIELSAFRSIRGEFWIRKRRIGRKGSEENCFDSLFLLWSCELNTFFTLFRCNMNTDCVDGSDEKGCERLKNRMCQKNQFTCSDGKCVNVHNVCDGIEVKDFWIWNNHTNNMSWFETEILHDIELFFWWRWEGLPKAWTCYMPFRPIQMLG